MGHKQNVKHIMVEDGKFTNKLFYIIIVHLLYKLINSLSCRENKKN